MGEAFSFSKEASCKGHWGGVGGDLHRPLQYILVPYARDEKLTGKRGKSLERAGGVSAYFLKFREFIFQMRSPFHLRCGDHF